MQPVIALVGRPNVGKSTLFNYLTRTRDALVADFPGLTRDRQYGRGRVGDRRYLVVDTGGLGDDPDGVEVGMERQVLAAIGEADLVVFLVDARDGLSAADQDIASRLRRLGKPVLLAVNKVDAVDQRLATAEFHSLGLGPAHAIAAANGRGVETLLQDAFARLPETDGEPEDAPDPSLGGIRVAVVGRPNVGKSTLVNRILGEDRVVVFDMPGTTRDSIFVPLEKDGQRYTLIDTAGVRRRSRIEEAVEKFSIIKTMQAIEAANVVIMVLDAREGITEQDAHLVGHIMDAGRGLVLAVNKWDGMDPYERDNTKRLLGTKLGFLDFAKTHFISALHGSGVGLLFEAVQQAYHSGMRDLSTGRLTQILEDAVESHPPPLVRGRRIKLRYAHQGGRNPPIIVIHGNQAERVPKDYRRYLANTFRRVLQLEGTPVRLEFRTSDNPYAGRVNTLSQRQIQRKRRLMKHVKSRK
ncbi:ribosome biogenesis GTPase Der [Methylonatrum kenyense]|uniref:ribosome biogenesis GTPase Der n=1 Tax=Methylonatrum kenyense TaxID=455253 RepID=UPI0020BF8C56|nr:ribosome biogenesis GTPase Der [Methylonatrum kenyense]MCK8515527.1 ribosome biogenesis GTPase Der [Methylonatrum kenyense]